MAWGWVNDAEWKAILRQLNRIEYSLKTLTREGRIEMATILDLTREVEETKGVAASVKVLVQGLKASLAEALVKLQEAIDAGNPAAIDAAVAELDAIQASLTEELPAAVVANPE